MRFQLRLQSLESPVLVPFNYQYPLSAAIYKIIERADRQFSRFLHDYGYTTGNKRFKLFTFSDLQTSFVKHGDRMLLTTDKAWLTVCFYMPQAAETFIRGLFMHQQIDVADGRSRARFTITQIESMATQLPPQATVVLQPLSPLVVGRKNERGHYDYRSPGDADFGDCLVYNWLQKWGSVHDASEADMDALRTSINVQVPLMRHPPQQRLITIKAGTPAETKVRGYTKFRLAVKAPTELLQLALDAGLGLHNAQGFGCVGVVE